MKVEYYDKGTDKWYEARIVSATIVPKDEEDGFQIYGDNLRIEKYNKRCPCCAQMKNDPTDTIGVILIFSLVTIVIACGLKYLLQGLF